MRNRKEGRKIRTRERQRKRKGRKGGGPKKAEEKQRETLKNKHKMPFFRGETGFCLLKKRRKESKEKKNKNKKNKNKKKIRRV